MEAVKDTEEGVLVDIEVSPKSSHFTISGYNEWRNEIEVKIRSIDFYKIISYFLI